MLAEGSALDIPWEILITSLQWALGASGTRTLTENCMPALYASLLLLWASKAGSEMELTPGCECGLRFRAGPGALSPF